MLSRAHRLAASPKRCSRDSMCVSMVREAAYGEVAGASTRALIGVGASGKSGELGVRFERIPKQLHPSREWPPTAVSVSRARDRDDVLPPPSPWKHPLQRGRNPGKKSPESASVERAPDERVIRLQTPTSWWGGLGGREHWRGFRGLRQIHAAVHLPVTAIAGAQRWR